MRDSRVMSRCSLHCACPCYTVYGLGMLSQIPKIYVKSTSSYHHHRYHNGDHDDDGDDDYYYYCPR